MSQSTDPNLPELPPEANTPPRQIPPSAPPIQVAELVRAVPRAASSKPGPSVIIRRKYPAPPPILQRIILLLLRPEQWAEAARFSFSATFIPLILISILSATLLAFTFSHNVLKSARAYAAGYDQNHPALLYKDGKLSIDPASTQKNLPRFESSDAVFAVDLENTKKITDFEQEDAIQITDSAVIYRVGSMVKSEPLNNPLGLPFPLGSNSGSTLRIDGAAITQYLNNWSVALGFFFFGMFFFSNLLWALVIAFLVIPVVMMAAPRLVMPRAVAFRIALASTIPLIALGAILDASGYSPREAVSANIGPMIASLFWFFAAAALAAWAGHLANTLFAARQTRRGSPPH